MVGTTIQVSWSSNTQCVELSSETVLNHQKLETVQTLMMHFVTPLDL